MISPTSDCGNRHQIKLSSVHSGVHLTLPARELMMSPSLQKLPGDSSSAYEMKFVLSEDHARQLETELRLQLIDDPHAVSSGRPGEYQTTTLYFDTPEFDVYHRQGGYARRKFRLRRYDGSSDAFLERKAKQGLRVRKRRSCVPLTELDRLQDPAGEIDWSGDWFRRRIELRRLSPVLALTYNRLALVGVHEGRSMRVTFDRSIRSQAVSDWNLTPVNRGIEILSDCVICEFKYREVLPEPFKALIHSQQLLPGKASKYRLGLEASGRVTRTDN